MIARGSSGTLPAISRPGCVPTFWLELDSELLLDFPCWGDLTFTLDVLNLLDSRDDDITYFYTSRLTGEPEEGVEDIYFHPVEPRMVRGSVTWTY